MSGLDLMADTNTLIYFLNGSENVFDIINENVIHISFVTEIELLSKNGITKKEEKIINDLISSCIIIPYNDALKQHIITFRKNYRLKMGDALIAASAYYHQLPLISADKDFSKVKEIDSINIS